MQKQLFDPDKLTSQQFDPLDYISSGAQRYAQQRGLTWSPPSPTQQVDHQRGHATYLAYRDAMKSASPSSSKEAEDTYGAMRSHVKDQYEFMTTPEASGGLGIQHSVTQSDPYKSPTDLADDLKQRRIKTFSSSSTGGHSYFTDDENDMFRAVHDVFGHAGVGRGFSRHGEEAAYRSHKQMFPKEALPALTSETRGQNMYLNYSPENDFPDQSSGLVTLPDWASDLGPLPTPPKQPKTKMQQEKLF
jgi:hypothetical protein